MNFTTSGHYLFLQHIQNVWVLICLFSHTSEKITWYRLTLTNVHITAIVTYIVLIVLHFFIHL